MTDRHRFTAGRATKNGVAHFPADPDARPTDRIVPGTPDREMGDTLAASNIRRALERGLCAAGVGSLDRALIDSVSASLTKAVQDIAHRQCCDLAQVVGTTEGLLRAEIAELRGALKAQRAEIAQLRAEMWGPKGAA